jgi:hypothetical protein
MMTRRQVALQNETLLRHKKRALAEIADEMQSALDENGAN